MQIAGITLPSIGIKRDDITSPKNLALGGIAATAVIGGGVIGLLKGSPLKGLGIGAAIASVALGAALLGNAAGSYRDGYCDSWGDADCDYPGTGPRPYYPEPYNPRPYNPDPYYPEPDYPGSYPGGYPGSGGATSPGDD